jgi:hypothetical protein
MTKVAKIRSRWEVLNLNDRRLAKDIDAIVEKIMLEAIEIWLRIVLDIITIWSSASHHTFGDVAEIIGTSIAASPVPGAPDRSDLGQNTGAAIFGKDGDEWVFEYETTLAHLIENEQFQTFARNTPYLFRVIANAASLDYIITQLDLQLPPILNRNITARRVK